MKNVIVKVQTIVRKTKGFIQRFIVPSYKKVADNIRNNERMTKGADYLREKLQKIPFLGKYMAGKYAPIIVIGVVILCIIIFMRLMFPKPETAKLPQKEKLAVFQQQQQMGSKPVLVKVIEAKVEDFEDVLLTMGTIRGYLEVDLKFGVNGSIATFNFKDGERVEKGELIATLEQEDALIKQEYAVLKREEYEKLYEIGAITESKLKQVRLEEELARIEVEKTSLRAPFNGVINNREAEKGKFVTINDRVATFSSIDEVVAEVGVIEKDIEKIQVGQRAIVRVDAYPNVEFAGEVDNISSSFEGKSRTLTMRVRVPNQKELLLPGMFARVMVYIYSKKNALIIPVISLEREAGEYFVFVVDKDMKAEKRKVDVAYLSSEKAVVEAGLEENELVVMEKGEELKDGDTVNVIKD